MNKLEISIDSKLDQVVLVENFIDHFYDVFNLSSELYGRITLSAIEAVNNAILHGNKRNFNKCVTIIATNSDKDVKITVMDEGNGFDYSIIPDPTLPDGMIHTTGRGLYLMKTLSDQLIFENEGSKVTLVFVL